MIPKIIHYCWFGKGDIPERDQQCIKSWKKLCPDYQFFLWTEDNYDISKNKYMYDAYLEKKWGFVPDYARFDIIYEYGGFYLDTDVELIKPLDELRMNKAYMGFEHELYINGGIGFGAEKGNEIIKQLRDMYNDFSFYKEDGTFNLKPSPHYITEYLITLGLERVNKEQIISELKIYPIEYFAPKDYFSKNIKITENTISIHHYNASWQDKHYKRMVTIQRIIGRDNFYLLVGLKNRIKKWINI